MNAYIKLLTETEYAERNSVAPFLHMRLAYHRIPCAVGTVGDWKRLKQRGRLPVRHENIELLDASRVRFGDPILHASKVTMTGATTHAMQAPIPQQFHRFWLFAHVFKTLAIFQMCASVEGGEMKVDEFLPLEMSEVLNLGDEGSPLRVSVVCTEKTEIAGMGITLRRLSLTVGTSKPTQIAHYIYEKWPESGVPSCTTSVHFLASELLSLGGGHAIVIGSAGIGRSGTLLLAAAGIQRARNGRPVRMPCLLHRLRSERGHAVQGAQQYAFAHSVVLHDGNVRGHFRTPQLQNKLTRLTEMSAEWEQERRRERRRSQTAAAGCASPGEDDEDDDDAVGYALNPADYPVPITGSLYHCEHCG